MISPQGSIEKRKLGISHFGNDFTPWSTRNDHGCAGDKLGGLACVYQGLSAD
jgi:hypothetical protein